MRAIILAAGRGTRMRPLSDETPKPLLTVGSKPLITYHLEKFAEVGIREIIINVGHLAAQFETVLGNGQRFGVDIEYSYENPVLETGGGIAKVLPKLGPDPFVAVSGDIFTDFPFERLKILPEQLAHLVLVDNPPHHTKGDYTLLEGKYIAESGGALMNFAGMGVYRPELFSECPKDAFKLPDLFKKYFIHKQITGEYYKGLWYNIGTPEQLAELDNRLRFMKAEVPFDIEQGVKDF